MISSGLKKFGLGKGLKLGKGFCYGNLNGFIATLYDGSGVKSMYLSTCVDQEASSRIMSGADELKKKYKLSAFEVNPKYIYIAFVDTIGTLKRIEAFTAEALPQLKEWGAGGADICPHCQNQMDSTAVTKLIYGHAVKLHGGCAEEILSDMKESEIELNETKSNAGLGILGSVLFGIIGAIPWAIVYALGYFVAWLGALIGFMIVKGYEVFGGKLKKSVIPVFVVITILCVVLAQFMGDAFQLGYYILSDQLDAAIGDIPMIISELLKTDSDYRTQVIINLVIGIIFAGIGVFGIFRVLVSRVSSQSKKVSDLEGV